MNVHHHLQNEHRGLKRGGSSNLFVPTEYQYVGGESGRMGTFVDTTVGPANNPKRLCLNEKEASGSDAHLEDERSFVTRGVCVGGANNNHAPDSSFAWDQQPNDNVHHLSRKMPFAPPSQAPNARQGAALHRMAVSNEPMTSHASGVGSGRGNNASNLYFGSAQATPRLTLEQFNMLANQILLEQTQQQQRPGFALGASNVAQLHQRSYGNVPAELLSAQYALQQATQPPLRSGYAPPPESSSWPNSRAAAFDASRWEQRLASGSSVALEGTLRESNTGTSRPSAVTVSAMAPSHLSLLLPAPLAHSEDIKHLTSHQSYLRHQIEAFQATADDTTSHVRGRNKTVRIGQVGIRCRHCAHLPAGKRQKGSTYFPATVLGVYQAAQNMSSTHLQCGLCSEMPESIRQKFIELLPSKTNSSKGGRQYWAESARQMGLVDTPDGGTGVLFAGEAAALMNLRKVA